MTQVSVIIPAYNEERGIESVVRSVFAALAGLDIEVLVVDDGSADATGAVAGAAGARVVRHPYNKGNGAAVKTGLREARHPICAIIDADGQHDARDLPRLVARLDSCDMVVGARTGPGYSHVRSLGNVILGHVASYVSGHRIPDLTSGLRVFRRGVVTQYRPILPNGFSFPSTSTLALLTDGYSVLFEPIHAKHRVEGSESKVHPLRDGLKFLTIIVRVVHLFNPLKIYIPLGVTLLIGGLGWSVRTIATTLQFSAGGVLLLLAGMIIVLMGFQIDQIASLRRAVGRSD